MNRPGTSSTVSSRPVVTQEWSLHAELTFSHDGLSSNVPVRQHSSDSGVLTSCSWNSQPAAPIMCRTVNAGVVHPCYGFQRGNILFTTTPPSRVSQQPVAQPSSCYPTDSSNDPTPGNCSSVPSRSLQPYNRRCKSTCSIILSGVQEPSDIGCSSSHTKTSSNRGTSCSPIPRCYHTLTHRCGDPVCYHASCVTDNILEKPHLTTPTGTSVPDIDESCEVCGGGRSPTAIRRAARANTFTTHFCTRVPERVHSLGSGDKQIIHCVKTSKDAAIQTSDLPNNTENARTRKTEKVSNTLHVPGEEVEDLSLLKKKPGKKLSRSPAHLRGKSPLMQSRRNSLTDSRASSPEINRKPRTVHIDVYCTGSEDADADADASNTSDTPEEGESWSSPQTVFESEKLRVVHTKAGKNQLPHALRIQGSSKEIPNTLYQSQSFKDSLSEQTTQFVKSLDSDDGLSSHYPSKESSYTTFPDTDSFVHSDVQTTSRDPSSSTISSSSCALFGDDYDSVAATSWKDTNTEIESTAMSNLSLALSDSFEYADAMDRLRIREKEKAWAYAADEGSNESKTWQSPNMERKHLIQQQKLNAYLEKHCGSKGFPLWKTNATEDSEEEEDDDETGDAWVFNTDNTNLEINAEKLNTIKRETTVKKTSDILSEFDKGILLERNIVENSSYLGGDSGSLSDSGPPLKHRFVRRSVIGPFGVKPPSPPPAKLESIVISPFTAVGRGTEQFHKAQKFGTIIGAFRKPGNHVGPAKNPECSCEHCRAFYENISRQGRTRSLGDMPCFSKMESKT